MVLPFLIARTAAIKNVLSPISVTQITTREFNTPEIKSSAIVPLKDEEIQIGRENEVVDSLSVKIEVEEEEEERSEERIRKGSIESLKSFIREENSCRSRTPS